LYGLFQPSFLYQTRTSERIGKLSIDIVFGPFLIANISLTWRFAWRQWTSLVTVRIALALLVTDSNKASISVIYGYAPNTKKIEIILSSLAKLLMAFTAICKLISLLTYLSASSF
jgi:hypothetical protein